MITIKTYKMERGTYNFVYKNYRATCGINSEMKAINQDRDNNDMTKYEPIVIYDIIES